MGFGRRAKKFKETQVTESIDKNSSMIRHRLVPMQMNFYIQLKNKTKQKSTFKTKFKRTSDLYSTVMNAKRQHINHPQALGISLSIL